MRMKFSVVLLLTFFYLGRRLRAKGQRPQQSGWLRDVQNRVVPELLPQRNKLLPAAMPRLRRKDGNKSTAIQAWLLSTHCNHDN